MTTIRLLCIVGVLGCGGSARSGEKGVLGFDLGAAGNAVVAKGGSAELTVTSAQKKMQYVVASGTADVIELPSETMDLSCTGASCDSTEGTLLLSGRNFGVSRITFSDATGLVDALSVKVNEATAVVASDVDGKVTDVHARMGSTFQLKASLKAGGLVAVAKTPFTWDTDGVGLAKTTANENVVTLTPTAVGVTQVTVHFGALTGQVLVSVDAM